MRFQFVVSDARDIAADLQFVKHFVGLSGGSESALDLASRGAVSRAARKIDAGTFNEISIEEVPPNSGVKSRRVLLVNLGKIDRFSIQNLSSTIRACMLVAIKEQAKTIAFAYFRDQPICGPTD